MDCSKVGMLIRRLRMEKKLTQAALAARLNLSAKTISKWERGLGCPDVTLLNALSAILDVDISRLLEGELLPNETVGGNMKNTKYYVCPDCGSISLCTGNAEISCCGRRLNALEMVKAEPDEKLHVEIVEDEWFISSDHPMEKDNYISFVAFQTGDKVELVKQYPEWNLQLRLKKRGHGNLIWYSAVQGLRYQLL
ncbi:MAG: helix-turn-helix domain-containing protein [Clostridia bacterium]|nr:helix-turn-helix domain-containing protein [Clostridia bacterium]